MDAGDVHARGDGVGRANQGLGGHQAAVAHPPDAYTLGVDILAPLQIGHRPEQIVDLAAAAWSEIHGFAVVEAVADAAAVVHRQDDVAARRQVLVLGVHPVVGAHRVEAEQHLAPRPAVEEQERWVGTIAQHLGQEDLGVDVLAVLGLEGDGGRRRHLRGRERGGHRLGGQRRPPPLGEDHRLQGLGRAALQGEDASVAADLRRGFQGLRLGERNLPAGRGLGRPDMHAVQIALVGGVDQPPMIPVEGQVGGLEITGGQRSCLAALGRHGVGRQPTGLLPRKDQFVAGRP